MTPKSGKAIAWSTFLLGVAVSILGNVGHAASDGMKPGEWAGAAFWPTALMLSVEILTRVRWQPERRWTIARFAGLVVVSCVAAVLSYWHLRGLMLFWGEEAWTATLGPLAVDGLMLIAATALLSISKERPQPVDNRVITLDDVPEDLVMEIENAFAQRMVQPDPPQVPVSAPERVPVSATAPAVESDAKPRQVQTSKTVPSSAAEEAAFQVWMNAPRGEKPSVRKLADMTGLSPSKAHRLITSWRNLETAR